ncbi:Fic family protein [Ferrovibrio sp.]|uniref:Fic/DOC family protein n=1 Tax=Ferrovibrio sp. TaxID=1917215 RepID=UPI0025BBFED1|nr:Fic family protein [Ferrovibrio sp.]MBX3453170.1 Fic family protein [Ferrovibrio sp.]
MPFGAYDAFEDPYLYRGTNTLRNRLGLRDPAQLEAAELELSSLRAEEPLPSGRFSSTHYRNIHRHLFRDVYAWAGHYRTIRTAKGGNWFCFPEHIRQQMNALFDQLRGDSFLRDLDENIFVEKAAIFLGELNAIHPFREGNGRIQLTFLDLIATKADHPLRLEMINAQSFMPAMVASFHKNYQPLQQELRSLLAGGIGWPGA